MIYLKSVAVGVVTGLGAAVLSGLALLAPDVHVDSGAGSGGIGAVSVSINALPIVVAALIGFVAGFFWTLRRRNRTAVQR